MSAKKAKNRQEVKKTRKQLRKEKRKDKKVKRNEYYTNRRKPGQFVLARKNDEQPKANEIAKKTKIQKPEVNTNKSTEEENALLNLETMREREKRQQTRLQKQMKKQRNRQLLEANIEEDRNIKQLEKQLKLNKRKSKSVPASFSLDGLDYLLEMCDPETMQTSALAEQQLAEVNDEFAEDLVLMTADRAGNQSKIPEKDSEQDTDGDETVVGKKRPKTEGISRKKIKKTDIDGGISISKKKEAPRHSYDSDSDAIDGKDDFDDNSELDDNSDMLNDSSDAFDDNDIEDLNDSDADDINGVMFDDDDSDVFDDDDVQMMVPEDSDANDSEAREDNIEKPYESDENAEGKADGTWEDIYGRLRAKDGSVITQNLQKYIPPAARKQAEDDATDKARSEKLNRLRKQLKGFLNRLAESNMHNITKQIEELYMNNSRHDMNNTITNLVMEALVSHIIAPERLLMEHVLLITILHANIGTEVGAHFLQTVIKQFDELSKSASVEDKKLDNIIIILAQLYNFKLFESKLVYEILNKLAARFEEKDVECILHILRNVGFSLRKDDPIALKNLILSLQKKAAGASDALMDNSRVKFMLDVLLAIKNNNVTKIPNYDTTYSEHLKKIMKGFIRKGNYVTQLNISLDDLLKADVKGKWWVVGSAWTGNTNESQTETSKEKRITFSQKLLDLAAKQRMNTDTRRNIFCIIMSAEDYLDAFEKLLHLGLKNQQEREIIHVILHCSLQEKQYNPYYATLAQKFCEHDRKYQMTIKYSIWDKLKALKDQSATQISNLAKLLAHLFLEKGLPVSTLKVVQFSDLDKVTLRFIRQILLAVLLHEDLEACKGVFDKVGGSDKLKMFRESLRLFLHHFLLRNLDSQVIDNDKTQLLKQRVKIVDKLLGGKERYL